MQKKINLAVMAVACLVILVCIVSFSTKIVASDFTIVTSFTILEDFARNVAGNNNDVRVLSQIGAEVHEWELTPRNFMDLEQANIVFYNGLNVEQWMGQVRSTVKPDTPIIAVGEICTYPTIPIVTGDYAGYPDPHIWMHPKGAIAYVEAIRDSLILYDPENAYSYIENATVYIDKLSHLEDELTQILSVIPDDNRVLITTEAAFIYLADAFRLYHDAVWGTNTEEEGTPQQLMRIIKLVTDKKPLGLFWESTGSTRYMLSISSDTKIPVYGPLYVDSIGVGNSGAENYLDMMRANAQLLVEVLAPDIR